MEFNIGEMDFETLKILADQVNAEVKNRQYKQHLTDWNNLAKVIKEYCKKYGCIEVSPNEWDDSIFIDTDTNFMDIGIMRKIDEN